MLKKSKLKEKINKRNEPNILNVSVMSKHNETPQNILEQGADDFFNLSDDNENDEFNIDDFVPSKILVLDDSSTSNRDK